MLQPLYHHSIELDRLRYGVIRPSPAYSDPDLVDAYRWAQRRLGFYPLFLAVGNSADDIGLTGYRENWRRVTGFRRDGTAVHVARGRFPNHVLLSFDHVDGVFMDYYAWHIVLNAQHCDYQITDREARMILKPSWSSARWLRAVRRGHCPVQLVTPSLDLRTASRVWVRNQQTQRMVTAMGFRNVMVRRLPVAGLCG